MQSPCNRHTTFGCKYKLSDFCLSVVDHIKVLGVDVNNRLTYILHVNSIVLRAKQRADNILRCYYTRYVHILTKALTVYVHILPEYWCSVWSSYLAGLIDNVEGVRRSFIKTLTAVRHLLYIDCLKTLKFERLKFRRINADVLLFIKIYHDLIDIDAKTFSHLPQTVTRDHRLKICAKNQKIPLT